MIQAIQRWFATRKMLNVQEFAHQHKNFLVIVCDPKDDTIFVSYRDKQVSGKIQSADGIEYNVVKNVLKASTFHKTIDQFLASIVDTLKIPVTIQQVSDFLKFIDGAIYRITKSLKFTSKDKA